MSFSIINKLSLLAEIMTIILFLYSLYGKKFKIDYKEVILITIDLIIMQGIDNGYLPREANISMYIVIATYCIWNFENNFKNLIINNALYIVFLGIVQMLCFFFIYGIFGQKIVEEYRTLGTNICMLILCIFISKSKKLHRISYYFQKDDIIIRVILLVGVATLLGCIFIKKESKGLYLRDYIFLAVAVLVFFFMTISWQSYKIKAKERELELKAYKLYEESYSNLIAEIRLKQHEFNNHINALYSQHLVCKTYQELVNRQKEYCENIIYDNRYEKLLKAGNSMLIGFLYGKLMEAEKRKIDVEYDMSCMELRTKLPMHKLIELVGNLLNNAMDALESKEDKQLYFSIREEVDVLFIEVRNVYEKLSIEQINLMFSKGYSSKGENRGLGLYSIKKMGREYGFDILCNNLELDGKNWLSFSVKIEKSV